MAREKQDRHQQPDLADRYSEIGIGAVAASARYEHHDLDPHRGRPTGAEGRTRSQARPAARQDKRKEHAGR